MNLWQRKQQSHFLLMKNRPTLMSQNSVKHRQQYFFSVIVTALVSLSICLLNFNINNSSAQTLSDHSFTILNMGDSYTSGPGLYPIIDAPCNRSGNNYAHRISTRLHARLTDVSCTGATTVDFSASQRDEQGKIENTPQFSALTRPYDIILISIGGNDIGMIDLITHCATVNSSSTYCQDAIRQLQQNFRTANRKVLTAYQYIRAHEPHALIIGVGYGEPIPLHNCAEAPLPSPILQAFSSVENKLNALVKKSVLAVKGVYVDTSIYTHDHNVCSPQPWYSGMIAPPPGQGIIGHPRMIWMSHMTDIILPIIRHNLHIHN